MKWEQVVALITVASTFGLGLLTFLRGTKSDQALNMATNVKNTYDAQQGLIDNLQEEVTRYQALLSEQRVTINDCEKTCHQCRAELADALRTVAARDAEINNLKGVVAEHEVTISKHERTINAMSRRTDRTPPRNGTEERRKGEPNGE